MHAALRAENCCGAVCKSFFFWHVQGQAVNTQGEAHSIRAKPEAVRADELTTRFNWLMPDGAGGDQVSPQDPQNLLNPVSTAHPCGIW